MYQGSVPCPYLKQLGEEIQYPIQGYCQRGAVCALRVVSIAEFQNFCSTGNYHHCPIYRSGMEVASFCGELNRKLKEHERGRP